MEFKWKINGFSISKLLSFTRNLSTSIQLKSFNITFLLLCSVRSRCKVKGILFKTNLQWTLFLAHKVGRSAKIRLRTKTSFEKIDSCKLSKIRLDAILYKQIRRMKVRYQIMQTSQHWWFKWCSFLFFSAIVSWEHLVVCMGICLLLSVAVWEAKKLLLTNIFQENVGVIVRFGHEDWIL